MTRHGVKMRYFVCSLILPIICIVLIVLFGIGAVYYGVADLLDGVTHLTRKHSDDYNRLDADV